MTITTIAMTTMMPTMIQMMVLVSTGNRLLGRGVPQPTAPGRTTATPCQTAPSAGSSARVRGGRHRRKPRLTCEDVVQEALERRQPVR